MSESTVANGTVFYEHHLPNGLQIVAQPMPDFESAAVSFYVRTGSRDEPDLSIAGVSHFLEHMVFKGTKTLDWQDITLEFNKIGAEINAFTSHESTVFYARVLGEYLERAVELLSDMMYPRLVESDFETEKEVIINEIGGTHTLIIELSVEKSDIGKIIGKKGKTINAIRTLLMSVASRNGLRVNLEIIEEEQAAES